MLKTGQASSDILKPSQPAVDVKPASSLSGRSQDEVMTVVPRVNVSATAAAAVELSAAASADDTDRASSPRSLSAELTGYRN